MPPLTYLALACLLLIAAFVVFRILARRDYRQRGKLTPLSSTLESSIFFLWGMFTWLDLPPGWPPAHGSPLLRVVSWSLIVVGLGAMFTLIAWFGLRRSLGQQVGTLVQAGPYRWSRNPQVLACGMAVVGYALLWPSWHTLGWVILYAVIAHTMVLTEEEHLRRAHGDEYVDYCKRTPRYFGIR